VGEVGLAHAPDEAILDFARIERRVCCTLDADFHRLLAVTRATAPSVVRIRIEGLKGAETAGLILKVLAETGAALAQGAAVTVTRRAVRVRCLPLTTRK
jgi:predicted nuclease of predicted toxin-antitoxin system